MVCLKKLFSAVFLCTILLIMPMQVKAEPIVYEARGKLVYQNGKLLGANTQPDFLQDVKKIEPSSEKYKEIFINYPEGYQITLPAGMQYDFSLSGLVVSAKKSDFSCTISKEVSPYEDIDFYIEYYQNRFYTNENFRNKNNFILQEDITIETAGYKTRLLTLTREKKAYTFAYQYTSGRNYTRYLFKGKEFNTDYQNTIINILNSYTPIKAKGSSKFTFQASAKPNPHWNEETKKLYQKYCTQNTIDWGIFTEDIYNKGIKESVPAFEKKTGVPFDIILMYYHLGNPLALESLKSVYDSGKIVEFTVQISYKNNESLFDYTPMFDLIEGKKDEEIRNLAKQIKSLQHPVLFRLNNEMNSDWTSYSGIVTLSDPELYKAAWIRIYAIFEEEQVDNAIWIWNPNDNNYPPSKWNDFLCYYPGDDYVQMIGITGYNTGNYYENETGEVWREFDKIYSEINEKYMPYFAEFPWIITEFASSSYGGNKVKWIERMFKNIHSYPNIKAAVWFSYADYDENGIAARPYWIDETPETWKAFQKGIQNER